MPRNNAASAGLNQRIAELEQLAGPRLRFFNRLDQAWPSQLGTLGSGNHFIELVADEQDRIWTFLHSGSRGVGKRIATEHINVANRETTERRVRLPDPQLAYLEAGTETFKQYLADLRWAQRFAVLNRAEMTQKLTDILRAEFPRLETLETIECGHNFAQWEQHDGEDVLVTRKGAIEARSGQMGLIPGSMGARSYVVRGRGNAEAFHSAPHGAGRRMSRSTAKETFTMADFDRQLAGIETRHSPALLDEIPAAYKDVDTVMLWADDLVEIVHEFRQLINVKDV